MHVGQKRGSTVEQDATIHDHRAVVAVE